VRCLKQQLRGVELHYLTKMQNGPVLSSNPNIDKIWLYDRNFKDLIPQLKSQGFDFVVDLHRNYRSAFVKRQLGVRSAAFPKLNIRKWLTVRFKKNFLPDIHIVDRYFRAARQLNISNDGKGLDYFIPPGDEVDLSGLPETHRDGFIAMVIGGKHNTKIFPAERIVELCNRLSGPVVLFGGKDDHERGDWIAARVGILVYNACGLYNINQSASLLRRAASVLTNDTGLMHIAAAFNKPVVSVWGNTIPAFGMYPYMQQEFRTNSMIAEVQGLSCRPCSKIGFRECPKGHFKCMNDIELDPVVAFLKRWTKDSERNT